MRFERQTEPGRVEVGVHVGEGRHEDPAGAVDDDGVSGDCGFGNDLGDAPAAHHQVDLGTANFARPKTHTMKHQITHCINLHSRDEASEPTTATRH